MLFVMLFVRLCEHLLECHAYATQARTKRRCIGECHRIHHAKQLLHMISTKYALQGHFAYAILDFGVEVLVI
jgi:hypothetical protein